MGTISDLLDPKRTCTSPGGCGNTSTKKQWLKNGDLCPFCNGSDYTGVQSGRINVAPAASRFEPKAPETSDDFARARAAINADSQKKAWKCAHCHHFNSVDLWVEKGYRCPDCGYRSVLHEVQGQQASTTTAVIAHNDVSQSDLHHANVQKEREESNEEPAEAQEKQQKKSLSSGEKRFIAGRIGLIAVIVIVIILIYSGIQQLGKSDRTSQVIQSPIITETVVLSETIAETNALAYEEIVIRREVFTKIFPVTTPWNLIKTMQLILYITAIIAAFFDRIVSNQWTDAAIALVAAFLTLFGSSALLNKIPEAIAKIPWLHVTEVLIVYWCWALLVLAVCLVTVALVSVMGTTDWTPLALYFALVAGGPIFLGHLGVIQTLFLIPYGSVLPVTVVWTTLGDKTLSWLANGILFLGILFALKEALKPYRNKSLSIGSLIILVISIVVYFAARFFGTKYNIPVLNHPVGDVGIVILLNFLLAVGIREVVDKRFSVTVDYKLGLSKWFCQFDVILSFCLISLFFIQIIGMV